MQRFFVLAIGLVAFAPATATAGIINLGAANGYNVFTLGNDTQSGTDSQGAVAVGGNAQFGGSGYAIATSLGGSTTTNLVVGGNYSNTYNTVNGNVAVGGNATINGPTINGNLGVAGNVVLSGYGSINGSLTYGGSLSNPNTTVTGSTLHGSTSLPVNFSSASSYLTSLSSQLMSATSTGTAVFTGNSATNTMGGFTLVGTNATSDVFHIKGSDLALAYSFNITAPAGATVVIDIDGTADSMQNFSFSYNGVNKQDVLFNFGNATTLSFSGIGIEGSVLAPLAAIAFNNGSIDGTLVGGSVSGGGESHNYQFAGDLTAAVGSNVVGSNLSTVPEPATIVSTALGLILVGGAAWRRRR